MALFPAHQCDHPVFICSAAAFVFGTDSSTHLLSGPADTVLFTSSTLISICIVASSDVMMLLFTCLHLRVQQLPLKKMQYFQLIHVLRRLAEYKSVVPASLPTLRQLLSTVLSLMLIQAFLAMP